MNLSAGLLCQDLWMICLMILRSDAVSLCDEVKNVMMILPNVDDVSKALDC